jgi:lysophospholipase
METGGVNKARVRTAAIITAAVVAGIVLVVAVIGVGVRDDPSAFADARPPPGLAERFYPPENWAWGEVSLGDGPIQRYGVSAPEVVARAQVLILPDYGESTETWFETARDLNAAGATVWILEGVGQGGSARLTGRRDLGEVRSFDGDVASVKAMAEAVIRPEPRKPLIVVGEGVGALVAARAAENGLDVQGLVLSGPVCGSSVPPSPLVGWGLGARRAPDGGAWRRDGPDDFAAGRTHDRWRGAVTHAWQVANPDLRLGGASLDWKAALSLLQGQAEAAAKRLPASMLRLDSDASARCLAAKGARQVRIAGADRALELEDDARRGPWLTALEGFIADAVKVADPHPQGHAP